MKKYIVLFLVVGLAFQVKAQRKPKIKGSKNVIEVNETLPPFNTIELRDNLNINLQRASAEGYRINADDNLIDVLKFEVQDSTLTISSFYKITAKKKLDITINYSSLRGITLLDGRILMKDIVMTDELTVHTLGSSKLELNAHADVVHLTMEGNSSGDFNFNGDITYFNIKGKADARIYVTTKDNTTELSGKAGARFEGSTENLQLSLSDNANFKGEKLQALKVNANIQGSAMARVYAQEHFDLSSHDNGRTLFYGNAKITLIDFLGQSQLSKEN